MPDILLVGNPSTKSESIKSKQLELSSKCERVVFEMLDRVSFLPSLSSSNISQIQSGAIEPAAYPHSMETLSKFAKSLASNGILELTEPVLVDSAALLDLQSITASAKCSYLPFRTERSVNVHQPFCSLPLHVLTSLSIGRLTLIWS